MIFPANSQSHTWNAPEILNTYYIIMLQYTYFEFESLNLCLYVSFFTNRLSETSHVFDFYQPHVRNQSCGFFSSSHLRRIECCCFFTNCLSGINQWTYLTAHWMKKDPKTPIGFREEVERPRTSITTIRVKTCSIIVLSWDVFFKQYVVSYETFRRKHIQK